MLLIGPLLLKNLREAVDMAKQCESACEDFEQHRTPDVIHGWKMMKLRWEKDPSQPDPFKLVEKGMSVVQAVRQSLTLTRHSFEFQCRKTETLRDGSV